MLKIFGGYGRTLNRSFYIIAERVADVFRGAEPQYLDPQRHRYQRPHYPTDEINGRFS